MIYPKDTEYRKKAKRLIKAIYKIEEYEFWKGKNPTGRHIHNKSDAFISINATTSFRNKVHFLGLPVRISIYNPDLRERTIFFSLFNLIGKKKIILNPQEPCPYTKNTIFIALVDKSIYHEEFSLL